MDNWETTFKKHEIIEKFPTENGIDREIQYLYIKMPMFMTDRDLVKENLTWNEYNGNPKTMLVYNKSTTHDKYPPKEKPIRADMIIGGIANDRVILTLDRYFAGELTQDQALGLLKFEKPNIQYCIRSEKMLNECLTYIKSEQL